MPNSRYNLSGPFQARSVLGLDACVLDTLVVLLTNARTPVERNAIRAPASQPASQAAKQAGEHSVGRAPLEARCYRARVGGRTWLRFFVTTRPSHGLTICPRKVGTLWGTTPAHPLA
ncbi:hypothetical protein HZH66_015337 [Vespula vulgaris]|uniref:Uncharacterized protein n=1 Tax=Vespula vulgaris TaxID=7454 RepID=A0A834IXN7_VESVU|nr:hypothetical protein HZH66_015337 [Vespula vulgaris]